MRLKKIVFVLIDGDPPRLCDNCEKRPAEVETSDHQCLCMTCAQDSHCPCDECGEAVPAGEVDENGTCIDCRVRTAARLIAHGNTAKVRRKALRWNLLLNAEKVTLSLIESGQTMQAGVDLRGLLKELRDTAPKFS